MSIKRAAVIALALLVTSWGAIAQQQGGNPPSGAATGSVSTGVAIGAAAVAAAVVAAGSSSNSSSPSASGTTGT